ncbi:hypothetical protein [Ralstonia pseudosolanacearum]|uniref:hypothetical protein n=1 Tax=Ralstonia pseudosolanacearum TaxID=1310165 RepID=UPI001FFBD3CC|nr:hypothetical protein [Ralstonia pseudosolanacearum]
MFAEFKLIAEVALGAFKALVGQQRAEWKQLGAVFDSIAKTLKSMAAKYEGRTVPIEEFIALQVYADELKDCWQNLPLSGRGEEVTRWRELLESAIITANGCDAEYFGFRSVPGPFYSRKEKTVLRSDPDAQIPAPSVQELQEAAAAFEAAAAIFKSRGA